MLLKKSIREVCRLNFFKNCILTKRFNQTQIKVKEMLKTCKCTVKSSYITQIVPFFPLCKVSVGGVAIEADSVVLERVIYVLV